MSRSIRDLRTGESAVLAQPTLSPATSRRLAELGLRAGETVTLAIRGTGGTRIVSVQGSRIALDGRTASGLPLVEATQ